MGSSFFLCNFIIEWELSFRGGKAIKISLKLSRGYQKICLYPLSPAPGWLTWTKPPETRPVLPDLRKCSGCCNVLPKKRNNNFTPRYLISVYTPINDDDSKDHTSSSTYLKNGENAPFFGNRHHYPFAPKDLNTNHYWVGYNLNKFFKLGCGTTSGTQGEGNQLFSKMSPSSAVHSFTGN